MISVLEFATLAIATMFALAAAAGLNWLFLEAAFALMQPATARRISVRPELAGGHRSAAAFSGTGRQG